MNEVFDAVFPLGCPRCGAEMCNIAFLTDSAAVRAILAHLGEPTAPPRIAPTAMGHARYRAGWLRRRTQPAPEYKR